MTGLVLAAGLSTRMGHTKQLVDLAGSPMVAVSVANAAASRLDRTIVVVGHDAAAVAAAVPDAEVVVNTHFERGNLSSFRAGLAVAGEGPVMVLLADMPGVTAAIIDRCCEVYEAEQPWALLARYTDGRGHPYILSPAAGAASGDYEGRRALYRMLREQPAGRVIDVPFDHPRPVDVNTPDDVAVFLGETR